MQSGIHHMTRVLQDEALSVFSPLPLYRHATVPFGSHRQVSR